MSGLLSYARFGSDSGEGVTNYYDGFGRLRLASTNLGGATRNVASDYDAHGNRTRITHPDGAFFEYAYDDTDRLFHVSENGPSITLASIFYDEQGRRSDIARNTTGSTTAYGYDPISRLEVLSHNLDGASIANDVAMGFTYNPASQIVTRELTNSTYEFPVTGPVRAYAVNGLSQYTQVGGVTQGWDANGNLTFDGLTTFAYDTENRLTSASGTKNASLTYDPLGRLYEVNSSSGVTRFVYDGDRLIAEYNGSGALQRRYVHGAGVDEPLVWYEGQAVSENNRRYLHAAYQGSIVATSNAAGTTLKVYTYDPYGITATTNTSRFQYTGQAAIPELGLLYYKARFYNPGLGRFMQTDPIGYEDDVNLYAYVKNDPLNNADPTGTTCQTGSRIGGAAAPGCKVEWSHANGEMDASSRNSREMNQAENSSSGHEYSMTSAVCSAGQEGCTYDFAFDLVDSVSVPFKFSRGEHEGYQDLFGLTSPNPITHVHDRENGVITNIAHEGHAFVGTVTHRIYNQDNIWYVQTTGKGASAGWLRDSANNFVGRSLFGGMHRYIRLVTPRVLDPWNERYWRE